MGFFNPGFLWFALGGAIPVIIHLLHRQKFRRVRWAAMEFLLAALKKTQRRLRLENLLLLLVRTLIMILLALAVARPFFREAPLEALGDSDTHHVFVVDVSASMGYKSAKDTPLDVARKAAEQVLDGIRAGDQDRFSLVTLSSFPETLMKGRNRKDQIRAAIGELRPADYGTSLHATLLEVRTLLDDPEVRNRDRRVYVFTDFQRVGWESRDEQEAARLSALLKQLSGRENTRFLLFDAGENRDPFNRAVVDLRVESRAVTTKRRARFTALVHNFSSMPFPSLGVTLHVDDAAQPARAVVLPPHATVPVTFEHEFAESGPHVVRVSLEPDHLDVDDRRSLALDVKTALRGLVVDGEPKESLKESETYAFTLALDPTREGLYFSVEPKVVELFGAEGLDPFDFVVLANVQSLTPDKIDRLEQYVRHGGGLLITLGPRVDRISFNDSFWKGGQGLSPAALEEVAGTAPGGGLERGVERRIGRFAADHPVFRTFRDKLRAAVYELVFYKYYRTRESDPDRVMASFDDNATSPALLEKAFGEGKVVLFTTTIDHEWNAGIAGHPPYLPLVWNLCEYLAMRPAGLRNLFVGDLIQLDLPVEQYQPPFVLHTPGERGSVHLSASPPERDQKFFRLFYPARTRTNDPRVLRNEGVEWAGAYRLTRQVPNEGEKTAAFFAVNLPPRTPSPDEIHAAEGNLDRISADDIRRRFPDFKAEFRGDRKEGSQEMDLKAPPGSNLWKHLLYLLLGFMLLESVLAWLFGRAKQ
jgi:uncharacterized membrane protein